MPDFRDDIRWLDVCRHRIRGVAAPYVLVIQHHFVAGPTRIAAPLVPARNQPTTLLAPQVQVGAAMHLALLPALAAVELRQLGAVVASAAAEVDAILDALDALFRGYPVGLSR